MFPRRCKKCRCYVAPHLTHCPRCGKRAESNVVTKPTKEQKAEDRVAQDEKLPTIMAKSIHWIPSASSIRMHEAKLEELRRLLDKAQTPGARNAVRSEIRQTKAHLDRKHVPDGKKGWTTELIMGKAGAVAVFISPKQHRYVLAERDGPADLLIIPRKKIQRTVSVFRLQRFEKSGHARALKRQEKEAREHTKRSKSKKAHRAKRKLKRK